MIYRIYLLLFLLSITWLPSQAQTQQIKKLKAERGILQKKITASENLLQTTRKDVKSQLSNLVLINAQIDQKEKYVQGIKKEVQALDVQQKALQRDIKKLEAQLKVYKQKYKHALMFAFRNRMRYGKWVSVLSAKDFRQMTRRLRYVSEYGKYQKVQGEAVKRKEQELQAKHQQLTKNKADKAALLKKGEEQKKLLEEKRVQQDKVVKQLSHRQSTLHRQIAQQKRDALRLNQRIDYLVQKEIEAEEHRRRERLERERKAREEAERKAAQESSKHLSRSERKAEKKIRRSEARTLRSSSEDMALSGSFSANRGRLPIPITGSYTVTAHYGTYQVKGLKNVHLDNKGINLTGHVGAQARAIFNGEVTAIFNLDGLYNIIVRHGSYLSVYCNLQNVSVSKGQKVSSRQTLGTVARDAAGNATLHFQLRKETTKLNPESWLLGAR